MRWLLILVLLLSGETVNLAGPITAVSYSPDGALLAAAEHNLVHILDTKTRTLKSSLRDLPGRISGVKFSKDYQLAVACGQVGQSGVIRLYDPSNHATPPGHFTAEFNAHKDAIYALDFSPDGQLLATGSYDRTIKLWKLQRGNKPTLLHTLTDHSDSVYAVAFHPQEPLLASGAADRSVKIWNTQTGARLYTLGDSTDWVYDVAWSLDGKQLLAGGVDRSLRAWNVNASAGQLRLSAFAHDKPILKVAFAADGTLFSVGEDRLLKSWKLDTLTERTVFPRLPGDALCLAVSPSQAELVVGLFTGQLLLFDRAAGKLVDQLLPPKPASKPSDPPPLPDRFASLLESGPTDSASTALLVKLPVTVSGQLDRLGDVDYFRFELAQGQELGIELVHRAGGAFVPWLSLTDATGRVLQESTSGGLLGFVAPQAGTYAVAVRDRDFRGGPQYQYKLSLGPIPIVQGVFPLAIPRGESSKVHLIGVNLPKELSKPLTLNPPPEAGDTWPLFTNSQVLGLSKIAVRDGPALTRSNDERVQLTSLGSVNGVLRTPGIAHEIEFSAQANQPLVVEVHAARLGSPLDSYLEILDEQGQLVPRVQLRGVAKTFVTFRDHDSEKPGIRLDAWNELAIDDYVLIGPELARIKALPKGPDDDCLFYTLQGVRAGQLGTTPVHQALGTPVIKVEFHPPTAQLPPNGFPSVILNYSNDDGGPGFGKDSFILFTPPKSGNYRARVRSATGAAGPLQAYRLTIREPKPSFQIQFSPMNPNVRAGEGLPITLTATRVDGFNGPIQVSFADLPKGWQAPSVTIGEGQESTSSQIYVPEGASPPTVPLKLFAQAVINGQTVSRELGVGLPKLAPRGDLTTSTNVNTVVIQPGGEARLVVMIQRHGDFQGRVPLDVHGLPHGVRVLNIGLNGILITPNVTRREIVLYAEPWVKPQTEPIVVLSRSERKGTEHAAPPVLLQIRPPGEVQPATR